MTTICETVYQTAQVFYEGSVSAVRSSYRFVQHARNDPQFFQKITRIAFASLQNVSNSMSSRTANVSLYNFYQDFNPYDLVDYMPFH